MSVQKYYIVVFCLIFYNNVYCSNVDLIVETQKFNKTNENFLSVALDTVVVAHKFKNFNMTNKRLIKMVSYLSPGYLRLGGNLADMLYFSENEISANKKINVKKLFKYCFYNEPLYCSKLFTNFTMSGSDWQKVNMFAKDVGLTIIFDLNCLIRHEDGSWNSKNAEELIKFSEKHGFNVNWQLGNEPDDFKHLFNYTVNATQLAKDFSVLKTILEKYPRYKKSLLVGPDVTRPRPEHKASARYLEKFLNSSKQHILDAVTWHQYYLNGKTAKLEDFLNPDTFMLFENQIKLAKDIVNKTGFNNTPMWLGETSTAYGGGAPGLSNSFAGSFLWLDKLGLAAKYGIQIVIRQSLFKGHYALIYEDYQPSPDWWISVLYKRIVGPKVLACDIDGVSKTVRLYCHCTKTISEDLNPLQQSAITVFGININEDPATVNIKGLKSDSNIAFAYIFTAENLTSKHVYLNGQNMTLSEDGDIPFYKPEVLNVDEPMLMLPYSLVFWMIPIKNGCLPEEQITVVQI